MIHNSIRKCDADTRPYLYQSVFLSGGSTTFHGIADRLQHELTAPRPAEHEGQLTSFSKSNPDPSHSHLGHDRRSPREGVLPLDRWIHLGFPFLPRTCGTRDRNTTNLVLVLLTTILWKPAT
jgi:hypothetical protein